jgi:hypothetical protein
MQNAMVLVAALGILGVSCGQKPGTLDVTLLKSTIVRNGWGARVRVVGTESDGRLGRGEVSLMSSIGAIAPESVALDEFGTVVAELTCSLDMDPGCAAGATVTVSWVSNQTPVEASLVLRAPTNLGEMGSPGFSGSGGSGSSGVFLGAGKVLLLGTAVEGTSCREMLADPRRPDRGEVAFPCDRRGSIVINQNNLYYASARSPGIRVFEPEDWDFADGRASYPSSEKNPDRVIRAECGTEIAFQASPSGRFLHTCRPRGMGLFVDGEPVAGLTSFGLAFGDSDTVLQQRSVDIPREMSSTFIRPELVGVVVAALAVSNGFLAVTNSAAGCVLHRVELSGASSRVGQYRVGAVCAGKLDDEGRLTQIRSGISVDEIWELSPDGNEGTRIYTEADATPDDLTTKSPRVYTKIHGSTLVGGN